MFWRRRKPDWFIDPSRVAFGSVVDNSGKFIFRIGKHTEHCDSVGSEFLLQAIEPLSVPFRERAAGGQKDQCSRPLPAKVVSLAACVIKCHST